MFSFNKAGVSCIIFLLLLGQEMMAQDDLFTGYEQRKEKAIAGLAQFTRPDTARVNALIKVFTTAVFLKQRQELQPYCQEALAVSRRLGYQLGLAACYLGIGQFYKSSLNATNAHIYFDSVIYIAGNSQNQKILELKAWADQWKAMLYYEQDNYYPALNYFFESLKYFEYHRGNSVGIQYPCITTIYMRLNNLEKAEEYARKYIAFVENDSDKLLQAAAYFPYIDICIERKELQPALLYLDKISTAIPDSEELLINYGYYEKRGKINFLQQKYGDAFLNYEQAYKYAVKSGHKINICNALNLLSTLSLKSGKKEEARKYALQNLALAGEANTKTGKIDALLNLSDYYNQTGNAGKAFSVLRQALIVKDSLVEESNIKQINSLGAIYESDKKQKEILQLQDEKKIQMASVEQKSTLNKVFISTIIGLLVFGYLAFRTVKSEQKIASQYQEIQKQRISELEKDRQILTVNAMLKGQEEERSRIAKDLHDGLGGMLSGVKLSFINMKENMVLPAENVSGFERSIEMLDNTISELRKVAHNLMPETLVRFGLDEALRDFCNSIQTTAGIEVVYQQFGEDRKLSTQAAITVYRIIQELVNNALKYSEAKQIIVQLTKNHIKTGITVEDNGKGFDVKTLDMKKGAGFSNIKYRVNYFKGTLDINSQPGNGTSVSIELMA